MAKRQSSSPALIPAAAYTRRSTKGKRADGRERQENSIANQRLEIETLARKHGYKIVRWYSDEGISGTKMGAKRPGFQQLIADAEKLGDIQAVVVDDLDRFSRAKVMQTFGVYSRLAEYGVKAIHSANDGEFPLDDKDIGTLITLVVKTHGSNAFAIKLGNRIAETRRNRAKEGRRSGGYAPYGLACDKQTKGLIHGGEAEVVIVRWLFDQFANKSRSLWSLANELNAKATPTRRGRKWSAQTIKDLLANEAYKGNLVYNRKKIGDHWIVDAAGEVVESKPREKGWWRPTEEGVIRKVGAFKPLIEPALFDLAQRKLATLKHRTRRPRSNAYVLTGVLHCDHCGKVMFGRTVEKHHNGKTYRHVEYRCQSYERHGKAECGYHTVREEKILPFVMRTLGEEIDRLRMSIDATRPYFGQFASGKGIKLWPRNMKGQRDGETNERAANLQRQAEELDGRIKLACENILGCQSAEVRRRLDLQVAAMIEEQKRLLAEVETAKADEGHAGDDYEAVREVLARIPYRDGYVVSDGHSVRETLLSLGTDVRLRWDSEDKVLSSGRVARYHTLAKGRLRLGQFSGKIPIQLCQIPTAGSNNGIRGAGRSGSRRGKG
jgi:DNA invertase Pin-like site-specific DNA recombinase